MEVGKGRRCTIRFGRRGHSSTWWRSSAEDIICVLAAKLRSLSTLQQRVKETKGIPIGGVVFSIAWSIALGLAEVTLLQVFGKHSQAGFKFPAFLPRQSCPVWN
ncbi:unnamed protein product [Prorocentrum cordatum]|uniref:Uncharacterized protein n=1 Tax=Prorocentrum cordatum TaxID=2364126 RepID=A0ABN9PXL1_9DINO|nr:unnamed protein product [Polarella glacialis]